MDLTAVLAVVNITYVAINAYYAWTTRSILEANRCAVAAMEQQTEALLRPYVMVKSLIPPGKHIILLTIANTGRSVAEDLKLDIDRSFHTFDRKREEANIASRPAFVETIKSFAPGSELTFELGPGSTSFTEADNPLTPAIFNVTARYSYGTKRYSENTEINLRTYAGSAYPDDPIQTELAAIKNELGGIRALLQDLLTRTK